MIEREVRYRISDEEKKKVINTSKLLEEKSICVDLCMGKYGFDSLDRLGYIIRLRNKSGKIVMECKKRLNNNTWEEVNIPLENMKKGYEFLSILGLSPYLYINRKREVREIKQAKIFIDEIELLGTFVEFEIKDEFEFSSLEEYLKLNNIKNNPEKLYGDIFKDKIQNNEFKIKFENSLNEFLQNN